MEVPPDTEEQRSIHQIDLHNNRETYSYKMLVSLACRTVTRYSSRFEIHNKFAPQFLTRIFYEYNGY